MADRVEKPVMGLIAGQGTLPLLVAEGMRARGYSVVCVGLSGQYLPELPALCDRFRTISPFRLGAWARTLRRFGAREAVMVGRVDKAALMHGRLRFFRFVPDLTTALVWYRRLRHDRRSPAILAALAETLESKGVPLIDSTTHIPEHLATEGVMTRRQPSPEELEDVRFGWPILRELLRLDIGQSIAVREKDVVAVEAVEGTDRMIERAGAMCRRGGWTLLKSCRADHDRRADVPTVGVETIRNVHAAGGTCIALGVGNVILADRERVLALADELGVSVVGVGGNPPGVTTG
ncbi:MAG: LpxI family protein [Phycisphaerales bacterium]